MEGGHRAENTDALTFLRSLPDSSVRLIVTDPPYFRVKPDGWDRAWSSVTGFADWLKVIATEWQRVLKPNGTLLCFAGANPANTRGASAAAYVEVMLGELFNVTASVVWVKTDKGGSGRHNGVDRSSLRTWFPQTERVIVCEHYGADNMAKGEAGYVRKCDELRGFVFEPLRAYLDSERERAGVSIGELDASWKEMRQTKGCMVGHWFNVSQWALPTRKNYEWLRVQLGGGDYLRREYDDLRREYDDLRREYDDLRREYDDLRREYDDLRRPFDALAGEHFTDAWQYQTLQGAKGKHPCAKPPEMARDIIAQCSRPGDVVLDCFAGSGVFLAAAAKAGRIAWGCDADAHWAEYARIAIDEAVNGPPVDTQDLFGYFDMSTRGAA